MKLGPPVGNRSQNARVGAARAVPPAHQGIWRPPRAGLFSSPILFTPDYWTCPAFPPPPPRNSVVCHRLSGKTGNNMHTFPKRYGNEVCSSNLEMGRLSKLEEHFTPACPCRLDPTLNLGRSGCLLASTSLAWYQIPRRKTSSGLLPMPFPQRLRVCNPAPPNRQHVV